ncbi:uncharacterized protein LOC142346186 [Convolutriloba macropyga]|uniref:uncharacterized protein LOC142346186 n=1 Tax=Convolutriloba macropyga TaxID=536237 RepID=UPI003F523B57
MDRSIGGMENAGLITMSSEIYASCTPQKFSIRYCENAYTIIIHEIIHQWTGGLMTNEWWSNVWLNEGFTTFFQSEVTRALVKFNRLSINANSIVSRPHSLKEMAVHDDSHKVLAVKNFDFFGFAADFYHKAGYAVSLLDAAMNDNLMVCMGVILAKFPYQSMTAKFVVDELTDCPYSTVNVTEFMRYWLFDEKIPILKVEVRLGSNTTKFQNTVNKAFITYSFLCSSYEKLESGECHERESNFQPHFAVVFRDVNNHVLQNPIIVNENNSMAKLYFDLEANPLYFINAYDQGNFLVHYPDEVYNQFFVWINDKIFANKIKLAPFYKIFVMDMFELSRRGRINMYWLYMVLQNQNRLDKAGIIDKRQIEDFEECLDYDFFANLPRNATIQKFGCNWRQYMVKIPCGEKWDDLVQHKKNAGNKECKVWIRMFGEKFEQLLEDNYDSADFSHF